MFKGRPDLEEWRGDVQTVVLAILVLSLVPGTLRPHTMILPPGFEHVAAFFLGLGCHHRVPPCSLLCCSLPMAMELGQLWVPGRNGQLPDIGADLAGASIGVMAALATMHLRSFALPR